MPTVPRLVYCPKCRVVLQEPPPGNPLYQCGKCSTTLQAKHATPKDLESSRRSAELKRRPSYSDSSSGEIGSDAVADEYPVTGNGNGNESPLYKKKQSVTQAGHDPENGSRGRHLQGVTNPWRSLSLDGDSDPDPYFPKSVKNQEHHHQPDVVTTQQRALDAVSGSEYPQRRASAAQNIEIRGGRGRGDHWASNHDAPYEMPVAPTQQQRAEARSSRTAADTDVTAPDELKTMSSVGHPYETETLTSDSFRTNGKNPLVADELQQQLQEAAAAAHVPRTHPHSPSIESEPPHPRGNDNNSSSSNNSLRDLPTLDKPHDNSNSALPQQQRQIVAGGVTTATGHSASRSRPTRQLRWQARESDSGDEALSSGAGSSSKGISEDDDGSSQDDARSLSATSLTESSSTPSEYKVQRGLITAESRRRPLNQGRRSLDEQEATTAAAGQQHLRAPSDDSERAADMYESSSRVQDYEQSDTSSTTMDDVESNGGGAGGGSGQFSGELDRHPSSSQDQPASRSAPRLNLPRSTTNSSRGSGFSEDGSSYGSPSRLEMLSPDNDPLTHNAKLPAAGRRHSWDERTSSRMGAGASGYTGPHQGSGPSSVRMKSPSQDFGGGSKNHLNRLSSINSDPGGRPSTMGGRHLPTSSSSPENNNYNRPGSYPLRSASVSQTQWANRYVPPSQSTQQQWSPNSPHRPYFPEPSPLHPLTSRLSVRQVPGGQLPPKQGHYPPLPPLGALPHVLCQHCGLLLAVPDNLPPTQKNTQKLRCGSCRKISIFSVPQAESGGGEKVSSSSSRADSLQNQPMLASSPDSQADFSTYRTDSSGDRQKSVRRHTSSDLAEKQVLAPLARKHSLGNEDLSAADPDMVDRALSERVETLAINSAASSPSSFVPWTEFRSPSSQKSGRSGEIPYHRAAGPPHFGSLSPSTQKVIRAGDGVPAEEKFSSDVDSESDSARRSLSATGSPQLNQGRSSRSPPPPLASYSPLQDPKSGGRLNEEGPSESRRKSFVDRIFKNKNKTAQYRRKVVVNSIPIPDNLVKKAEEQAGPIHPGTYWYDSQAGFWGVAGGQCLGIIPPFIEEINHPMTRDCAAGRTGIFVNKRELHHLDRDKLCRRGLPDTPGMSYIIEIDGRVIEEASRSELRSLGRLAPSLEKSGRGAGMQVPSHISGGWK